ncbi:DUF4256 domain-containing protein [Emticicia sp. 17c]|uniref:DUF4256 domain-containing protein n=1 Tax=Emticicia sp. 17c TaxID=3127704 RepID=UPI00301C5E5C
MIPLSPAQQQEILGTLQTRFGQHKHRHAGLRWEAIAARLQANEAKLWSLHEMEYTGGEPDVIGYDAPTDTYLFCDCSAESPEGRRSVCYDHPALHARKAHKPANSAMNMAESMGIRLLTEAEYRALQQLGNFDTKTSSWIQTPPEIRKLGGALFGDRRYNQVFVYHNGADAYYGVRGFRGLLHV